jgi:hypothetical protein
MHKIVEDILYIGDVQKGCKCEEEKGEIPSKKGRISLVAKHNELVCMIKINKDLLEHLGISEDDTKTDDCIVLYTSCRLKFKVILILIEFKVSGQDKKIFKAEKQLMTLIKHFQSRYGKEWNEFLRKCLVVALIVHNRPAIPDGTEISIKGVRCFFLRNPAVDSSIRKEVIRKLETEIKG